MISREYDTQEQSVTACPLSLRMPIVGAIDRLIRSVNKSRYPQTHSRSDTRCDVKIAYLRSHTPRDDLCKYHDPYPRERGLKNVTDAAR